MELGSVLAIGIHRIVKEKLRAFGARSLMWCVYHGPLDWLGQEMVGQPARTLEETARSEVYALIEGNPGNCYRLDEKDPASPLTTDSDAVPNISSNTNTLLKEKGHAVE